MKAEEITAAAENIGHFLNIVRGAVVLEKALADTAALITAADDAQARLTKLQPLIAEALDAVDTAFADAKGLRAEADAHAEEVLAASEALKIEATSQAAALTQSQVVFQGIVDRQNAALTTREEALVSREADVIYREALQIERAGVLSAREVALEAKLTALRAATS